MKEIPEGLKREGLFFSKLEVMKSKLKNGIYGSAVVPFKEGSIRVGLSLFPFREETQCYIVLKEDAPLTEVKKEAISLDIPLNKLKIRKSFYNLEEVSSNRFITVVISEEGISPFSELMRKGALLKERLKEKGFTQQVRTNIYFPKETRELLEEETTPKWLKVFAKEVKELNGKVVLPSSEGYKVSMIIEPDAIYLRAKLASNYADRSDLEVSVPSCAITLENSENLYAIIPISSWEEINQIKKELFKSFARERKKEAELEPEF